MIMIITIIMVITIMIIMFRLGLLVPGPDVLV